MPQTTPHTDAEHDAAATALTAMRDNRVLWHGLRTAARHLFRLVVPALVVFLPILALTSAALAFVVHETAALVNGEFVLFGTPTTGLLAVSAVTLTLSAAGQALVVVPATAVLATGLLLGRPVTAEAAMLAALRRLPALLALALIGALVFAAIVAAGFGMLVATEQLFGAFAVMVPLALLSLPLLLALPVVLFEGRSAGAAIRRSAGLARTVGPYNGGYWWCGFTLAFGVLVVPGAVQQGAQWALSGTPLLRTGPAIALGLIVPAFQATVIARLYLHRLAIRSTPAEFAQVAAALPDAPAGRARPVAVLAALLAPGLVYGTVHVTNPLGWLEVTQTAVTDDQQDGDGGHASEVYMGDLRSIHAGQDGNMVMLMDSDHRAALLTCRDADCTHTDHTRAEPWDVHDRALVSAARLVGGRLVLTSWSRTGIERYRLRLLLCDAYGCAPTGGPIADVERTALAAVAAHPDGRLAVAHVSPAPASADGEIIRLIRCADLACTERTTKELARFPTRPFDDRGRGLLLSMTRGGNPVVLRLDERGGAMSLITCTDDSCDRTRIERLVDGDRPAPFESRAGAALAVREDGRPVIAYRDPADGSIRLLDCRNPWCSQSDMTILSGPDPGNLPPALLLDESGRAVVAYQDVDREHLVLAVCRATRCARTPVARMEHGLGYGLAMAWDGQRRPVIAWMGVLENRYSLVVTIPRNPPSAD